MIFSCGDNSKDKKEKLKVVQITNVEKNDLIEQFTKDIEKNMEASNNKNWDVALDMTYPKLFNYVARVELEEAFESISDVFKDFQLKASNIRDLHPIINYNGLQFTRFFYDSEIIFTFYNTDDFNKTLPALKDEYGEDNIKDFRNTNSITVSIKSSMIAILQENSSEWKYLEWKEDIFNQFDVIPTSILEQLK
jgi:hypothetical protein